MLLTNTDRTLEEVNDARNPRVHIVTGLSRIRDNPDEDGNDYNPAHDLRYQSSTLL